MRAIPCCKCDGFMHLGVRQMKCKNKNGDIVHREYISYRCKFKLLFYVIHCRCYGRQCQTFKSVRCLLRDYGMEERKAKELVKRAQNAFDNSQLFTNAQIERFLLPGLYFAA